MKTRLLLMALGCMLSFTSFGQLESFGIIGSATPIGNWDEDIDLSPNEDSTVWTIQLELFEGAVKWRPNNDWEDPLTDWGGKGFPYGDLLNKGEDGDAPDIAVYPGLYDITVDLANKTYSFQAISDVGIIGSATAGGWDADTDMIQDVNNPGRFFTTINLTADEFKFRAGNDWPINWGGDWPGGDLIPGAPGNIVCPKAGNYDIEIDTVAGTWSAMENVLYESIGIIGDATPGGWETDTDLSQNPITPSLYEDTLSLTDGEAKFRANNDWPISWAQEGPDGFPMGVGTSGPQNISVTGGDYYITLDVESGAYNFRSYSTYTNVGLIGVMGDFGTPVLMNDVSGEGFDYRMRVEIGDDNLQFVGFDDPSDVVIYGSSDFPAGTAIADGSPIPTAAGEYFVNFSTVTGRYSFEEIIEYDAVSLVGNSGPFLMWPADGDGGASDFFLTQDPDNGDLWTGSGIELIDFDPDADGGIKFRADTAWTINWGAVDFPVGVGTQNGPNIEPVGGMYSVAFNSASGEYTFMGGTATEDGILPSDINVFPNPTQGLVNIDLSAVELNEAVSISVIDITGKQVLNTQKTASNTITLDVSQLGNGAYFMHIRSESFMLGKQFMIMK